MADVSNQQHRALIHRGVKFDLEMVKSVTAEGVPLEREVVRHPGAVVILAITSGGDVALIRNHRIAVGEWLWELPAGTLEPGEEPRSCAARELIEEAGLEASSIKPIGTFYTTPGMTDELMHAFLATDLKEVGQRLEPGEQIQVHMTPIQEAMAMIDRGILCDGKSMIALLLAQSRGMLRVQPAASTLDETKK